MISESQKTRLLLKDCAVEFYQHMYFLGKDVSNPKGNQLLEYGFVKSPSKGLKGTSCYTYQSGGTIIQLYGSCAGFYSDTSKVVFLRKRCRFYQWLPEHKLIAGQWSQEDIHSDNPQKMLTSLIPLLEWWLEYEKWIAQRLGPNYRQQCFADWKKVKGSKSRLSPDLTTKWLSQLLEYKEQHIRPKHFV